MKYPALEVAPSLSVEGMYFLWVVLAPSHQRHLGTGTKNAMFDLATSIKNASITLGKEKRGHQTDYS